MLQNKLDVFVAHWVILENIHTIPWTAERNSEGKAGNPKAWGGDAYNWNSEGMVGGGVDLEFPQGTDTECIPWKRFWKGKYPNGKKVNNHGILRA